MDYPDYPNKVGPKVQIRVINSFLKMINSSIPGWKRAQVFIKTGNEETLNRFGLTLTDLVQQQPAQS